MRLIKSVVWKRGWLMGKWLARGCSTSAAIHMVLFHPILENVKALSVVQ